MNEQLNVSYVRRLYEKSEQISTRYRLSIIQESAIESTPCG